jgi:hypothetical protein
VLDTYNETVLLRYDSDGLEDQVVPLKVMGHVMEVESGLYEGA